MADEPKAPAEAPVSLAEAAQLVLLDPKKLRFFRHGDSLRLTVADDRSLLKVAVLRAFPLSSPRRYLSVRDGNNKELGMIPDPEALDAESRALIEKDLERRYLVPWVKRIVATKERFGTVDWEMETDRGLCKLTTRNLRENVQRPAPGRIIITDVDGNRFDIRDVDALDAESQRMLFQNM
ncbi:MAG: DUF1854 domain-containing protein [Planctomycetota bacterium]|nr:DUF1854 domain-containing protein [Planctomycetota bacterium]